MKHSIKKYIAKLSGKERAFVLFGEGHIDFDYFSDFEKESLEDQQKILAESDAATKWQILTNWCIRKRLGATGYSYDSTCPDSWKKQVASVVVPLAEWLRTDSTFASFPGFDSEILFFLARVFYRSDELRTAVRENAALLATLRAAANYYSSNDNILGILTSDQMFFEDIWNERGFLQTSTTSKRVEIPAKPWLFKWTTLDFLLKKCRYLYTVYVSYFLEIKNKYSSEISVMEIENSLFDSWQEGKIYYRYDSFTSCLASYKTSNSDDDLNKILVLLRVLDKMFKNFDDKTVRFFGTMMRMTLQQEIVYKTISSRDVLQYWEQYFLEANKDNDLTKSVQDAINRFHLKAIEIIDNFELLTWLKLPSETLLLIADDLIKNNRYFECLEFLSYLSPKETFKVLKKTLHAVTTNDFACSLEEYLEKIFTSRLFLKESQLSEVEKAFARGYCYQLFGLFLEAYQCYMKVISDSNCPLALYDEVRFYNAEMFYTGKIQFTIELISGKVDLIVPHLSEIDSEENTFRRACQAYEFLENNTYPEAANLAGYVRHRLNRGGGIESVSNLNSSGRRSFCDYILQKHQGKLGCEEVSSRLQEESRLHQQIEEQKILIAQQAGQIGELRKMLHAKSQILSSSSSSASIEPVSGITVYPAMFIAATQTSDMRLSNDQFLTPKPT